MRDKGLSQPEGSSTFRAEMVLSLHIGNGVTTVTHMGKQVV